MTSVDVARASGFSQATVARVFGQPQLVSEATRAAVEAAAEQLGYVPNAIARSLKSQRTNIVGALVPSVGEYWQHALISFSKQLADRGRQLLLFTFGDDADVDDVLASMLEYRLDGIIVTSSRISAPVLNRLSNGHLPVVAFNQPAASGILPSVSVDNAAGTATLARHIADQGCRTVTFVGGIASTSTDQQRYRGAAEALGGVGVSCAYLEAGSFSYDEGWKVAEIIASGDALPDAVMVSGDELAFGVVDGLRSCGLDVPNDLLLTGFDGLPQASWAGYDLTTVVQNVDGLVERALDLLLEGGAETLESSVPDVVVSGEIRLGRTTRNSPKGS